MAERPIQDESILVYWVNQFAVTPDQPGGTRHYDMSSELRRRGCDVRIIASDLNLTTRSYSRRKRWWSMRTVHEHVGDVPFEWLSAGTYAANDWRRAASMFVFAASALVHMLRAPIRRQHTVFIGSSPQLFAAFATFLAARTRRVPFVFEVRDLWPESYTEMTGKTGGPEVRVMRLLADLLYRRADAVVVLAPANRAHVIGRGGRPSTVHLIPNGVDLEQFDTKSEPPIDVGVTGRFTFVYMGTHGPANGLETVLGACKVLQERGDENVRVALVGDGPAKATLAVSAARLGLRNLTLHDPISKASVPAVLRSADAGLMVLAPVDVFSYGVSPNKLFDYLACDLPVVTNVPGLVTDIVESAEAGLVAAPGDAVSLADAMSQLASDTRSPTATTHNGRAYVAEHFDRRRLAGKLHSILEGLVSGEQAGEIDVAAH